MFDAEFSKVNRNGTSFITSKSPSVSLLDTVVAASNVANQTLASNLFGHDIPYKRNKPGKVTEL
jgi:hypothetical protein